MNDLIYYLDTIEKLIKVKQYDKAWSMANKGLLHIKGDDRFMMYYQMALIAAREKKWFNALEKMGFVIYYLKGLGGEGHRKFSLRLLKKIKKETLLMDYVKLAEQTHPRDLAPQLKSLLGVDDIR